MWSDNLGCGTPYRFYFLLDKQRKTTMSKIRFKCPSCQRPGSVDGRHAGMKARCSGCGQVVNIPGPPPVYPAAIPIEAQPTSRPVTPFPNGEGIVLGGQVAPPPVRRQVPELPAPPPASVPDYPEPET